MADLKISALPASTTPLAGTEVLPIVQGGATTKVTVANLTAGRAVSAASLAVAGNGIFTATSPQLYCAGTGNSANGAGPAVGVSSASSPDQWYWKLNTAKEFILNGYDAVNSLAWVNPIKINGNGLQVTGATGVTAVNGNFVPGTAAKGINFTANTPAAGMTSQLLNWYEEGTWTPTILGDSSAGSYSYDATRTAGKYTRIGKTVLLWAVIRPNVITVAGTGSLCIGGLPFPAASRYASNMNSSDDIRVNIQGAGANVSAVTYPPPLTGSIDAGASTAVVASFGKNYSVTTVIGDLSGVNWIYLVSGSYTCA